MDGEDLPARVAAARVSKATDTDPPHFTTSVAQYTTHQAIHGIMGSAPFQAVMEEAGLEYAVAHGKWCC